MNIHSISPVIAKPIHILPFPNVGQTPPNGNTGIVPPFLQHPDVIFTR